MALDPLVIPTLGNFGSGKASAGVECCGLAKSRGNCGRWGRRGRWGREQACWFPISKDFAIRTKTKYNGEVLNMAYHFKSLRLPCDVPRPYIGFTRIAWYKKKMFLFLANWNFEFGNFKRLKCQHLRFFPK